MAKSLRTSDLPILTETVDSTPLDLPTLTEAIEERVAHHSPPFSAKQCRQLAERLFPKLEAALLEAVNDSPDWQTAMQQLHTELPTLIRNALKEPL